MKKPIVYHQISSCERLSSIRKLSKELLGAIEEGDYELLEGKSMEALIMLLKALSQALEIYHEQRRN